jgi:hypothetical protein
LVVIAGLLAGVAPNAAAFQVATDPDETTGRTGTPDEGDVKTVRWWDEADIDPDPAVTTAGIVLEFATQDDSVTSADARALISFDLNANPNVGGPDGIPAELCVRIAQSGANWIGTLFPNCQTESTNSYFVTVPQPSPNTVQIKIPKSELVANGLAAAAPSYNFRLSNTNALNEVDEVPDNAAAVFTHTFGESPPPPPPPPPPPGAPDPIQAFDEQTVSNGAPADDVLSINAVEPSVALGSAPPGSTKVANVGDIDYINTRNAPPQVGNPWTVTVEATSLKATSGNISFTNLKFKAGTSISQVPPGPGDNPTPQSTIDTAFVAGPGGDPDPGQSYSAPTTIANAPATTQGSFKQAGSTLTLTVPMSAPAGSYTGKLRYTITG